MLHFGNCHGDMSQPLFVMFVGVIRQGLLPFSRFPTFIAPTLPRKPSLSVGLPDDASTASGTRSHCARAGHSCSSSPPGVRTHAHAVDIDRICGRYRTRTADYNYNFGRNDAENRRLLSGGACLPTRLFLPCKRTRDVAAADKRPTRPSLPYRGPRQLGEV